jgi:hypothetical protein
MGSDNMLLFCRCFFTSFLINYGLLQICAGTFLASKLNLEWGKIMKRATYNVCYPYSSIREVVRNNHEIFLDKYTVEPGYNDIGLCDTSSITSYVLWYQLIPHC